VSVNGVYVRGCGCARSLQPASLVFIAPWLSCVSKGKPGRSMVYDDFEQVGRSPCS